MADHSRVVGDAGKKLKLAFVSRTGASTTAPYDLTGKTVELSIRPATTLVRLTEFDPVDVTASVTSLTGGLVEHTLTAPQLAQLVAGNYQGQAKVYSGAGDVRYFPNDELTATRAADGILVFTIEVTGAM